MSYRVNGVGLTFAKCRRRRRSIFLCCSRLLQLHLIHCTPVIAYSLDRILPDYIYIPLQSNKSQHGCMWMIYGIESWVLHGEMRSYYHSSDINPTVELTAITTSLQKLAA